jgi:hypothetical protein
MVWWTMDQMSGCCAVSQYQNTHSSDELSEQNHTAIILWWWYEIIWGTWISLTCRTKIRDAELRWFKALLCGNRFAGACFAATGSAGFPDHPHRGKEYPMALSLLTSACNDLQILWSWGLQIRTKVWDWFWLQFYILFSCECRLWDSNLHAWGRLKLTSHFLQEVAQ